VTASALCWYGFTLIRDDLSAGYERGSVSPFSTFALVSQVASSPRHGCKLRTFHDDYIICVYQVVVGILTQKVIRLHGQLVFGLI
jgi:hypothetical protein